MVVVVVVATAAERGEKKRARVLYKSQVLNLLPSLGVQLFSFSFMLDFETNNNYKNNNTGTLG